MAHSGNQLIDPNLIFQKAQVQTSMHIAVFGCGRTGHLVFPGAQIVGHDGLVYAVDILKDILDVIAKRAKLENFENILTVWSDVERVGKTAIPEGTLDVVLIVNLLFRLIARDAVLDEARRLLKPKGRIVVVDWIHDDLPFCPPKDRWVNFGHITAWAEAHGFVVEQNFAAGKHHGGLVLYRHD